jgi:hypothetical protein
MAWARGWGTGYGVLGDQLGTNSSEHEGSTRKAFYLVTLPGFDPSWVTAS